MEAAAGPGARRRSLAANLAGRILDHARQNGLAQGAHLPEQLLADAFRVSRTPVRMALRVLEDRGVVESRPDRGFFLLRDAAALADSSPPEDPVYAAIARDRLDGLLPHRFNESEMMRRYGVTQAHLQRLLARMTREGWVDRLPGQGWEFQPILDSPRALEHSYQLRMLIEPAALLDPDYCIEPATLLALEKQQRMLLKHGLASRSASEVFELSAAFHEAIVAGSPNPFLLDAMRRVNRLRRLIEYRLGFDGARFAAQCRSNLRLLTKLKTGDNRGAAEDLRAHLDAARARKTGVQT